MVEPTHLKNLLVKSDHFPKVRGENEKYLSCHHPEQLFLVKKVSLFGGYTASNHQTWGVLLGPLKPYYPKDQTSGGIWKTSVVKFMPLLLNFRDLGHRSLKIIVFLEMLPGCSFEWNSQGVFRGPAELWKTNLRRTTKRCQKFTSSQKENIKHHTATGFLKWNHRRGLLKKVFRHSPTNCPLGFLGKLHASALPTYVMINKW